MRLDKNQDLDNPSRRNFISKAVFGLISAAAPSISLGSEQAGVIAHIMKLRITQALADDGLCIIVSPEQSRLFLCKGLEIMDQYIISISSKGLGNKGRSQKTPIGTHQIIRRIGEGQKIGAILSDPRKPAWITTRALQLGGLEPDNQNTASRGIFIHGTNRPEVLGKPASNGCIRLSDQDILNLFNQVPNKTLVEIQNNPALPLVVNI